MDGNERLQYSTDYSKFSFFGANRAKRFDKKLWRSMVKHGFPCGNALMCRTGPNGTYIIMRGHHRFDYAKRLGLGLWFIVDDTPYDIYDLEGSGGQSWSLEDFATSRAAGGNADIDFVVSFSEARKCPLSTATALLSGSWGSATREAIKQGAFKVGDQRTVRHANDVMDVLDACRGAGARFWISALLARAVSLALKTDLCEKQLLIHRLTSNVAAVKGRNKLGDWLEEIEAAYNYRARNRVQLKAAALALLPRGHGVK